MFDSAATRDADRFPRSAILQRDICLLFVAGLVSVRVPAVATFVNVVDKQRRTHREPPSHPYTRQ